MSKVGEELKGITICVEVDSKLLNILDTMLKHVGKENSVQIGNVIAIDEYGYRKSSAAEMDTIPEERIISRFENGITVKNA